jgi:hypothetical protein
MIDNKYELGNLGKELDALAGAYLVLDKGRAKTELTKEIVKSTMPYIHHIIRKMKNEEGIEMPNGHYIKLKRSMLSYGDLVGEAVTGLMEALPRYEPRGCSLSTFARHVIAGRLYGASHEFGGLLRLPTNRAPGTKWAILNSDTLDSSIQRIQDDFDISYEAAVGSYAGVARDREDVYEVDIEDFDAKDPFEQVSNLERATKLVEVLSEGLERDLVVGYFRDSKVASEVGMQELEYKKSLERAVKKMRRSANIAR